VMCGHILETGANAVIQSDAIRISNLMNIKCRPISELFKVSGGKANDGDSDSSIETDDGESVDSDSSHLPDLDAPVETRPTTRMPGLRKDMIFKNARKFLNIFFPFSFMLPFQLCCHAHPIGNFESFFRVIALPSAHVLRFQLYLPFLRSLCNILHFSFVLLLILI
jgi:hypothetical protein